MSNGKKSLKSKLITFAWTAAAVVAAKVVWTLAGGESQLMKIKSKLKNQS